MATVQWLFDSCAQAPHVYLPASKTHAAFRELEQSQDSVQYSLNIQTLPVHVRQTQTTHSRNCNEFPHF